MQMEEMLQKSKFFKALGEPNRLMIVDYLLKQGECTCICKLSKILKKDQSVVFRHIQILKEAKIINTKKAGQFLMCCINDKQRISKYLEE